MNFLTLILYSASLLNSATIETPACVRIIDFSITKNCVASASKHWIRLRTIPFIEIGDNGQQSAFTAEKGKTKHKLIILYSKCECIYIYYDFYDLQIVLFQVQIMYT